MISGIWFGNFLLNVYFIPISRKIKRSGLAKLMDLK